ncbi:ATP-grasp fold amidoligase family protein [Haloechinothrix sp. LS1_15]|uniref:ATP-grasp fold amidoligase family protein n=1 Tax=Haloechinothrix sp. LS1_15 TaxID=2652248 RepID=UPI00294B377F|nr:ATP-grasp fold amidoligase family protein [Haloechinothrix sp. LS1_15]
MPLKRAYGTARGVATAGNNFLVLISARSSDRSITGIGECQPRHKLTGDGDRKGDTAWEFLRAACSHLHHRRLRFGSADEAAREVRTVMGELEKLAASHGTSEHGPRPFRGTLLGIEVALLDTVARTLALSIAELLGKQRDDIGISISTISSEATDIPAAVIRQERYPMTRVKGLGDLERDWNLLETVTRANRSVERDKPLWMDINEALTVEDAVRFIDGLVERMSDGRLTRSVVLEGILPKAEFTRLAELQRHADTMVRAVAGTTGELDLRIMPDEGMWDADDLAELNKHGGCRALNIKAPKAGGLLASLDLARAAVRADPDIHICIGGMLGTSDVTAFALHNLARALPRVDYLTSVPPSNVEQRITRPLTRYRERGSNIIAPQKGNGLGTRLVLEQVEPYVLRSYDSAAPESPRTPHERRVEAIERAKESLDALITTGLKQNLHRAAMRDRGDEHHQRVAEILEHAEPHHVTHMMARELERYRIPLRSGVSFHAQMIEQSQAKELRAFRPGWLLDDKLSAYRFADELGLRRPYCDQTVYHFEDIEVRHPIAIKPVRSTGAQGVYLVFSTDRIVHMRDNKEFSSWDEMAEHATWLMSDRSRRTLPDRWMVEELVIEDSESMRPAADLKFYAFYGEILLIQESRRESGFAVRYWNPQGEPVSTGRHEDKPLADAVGPTAQQLETAAAISTQIPTPFMRIDMLRGENELVYGEFTPRPGYFDEYSAHWDRAFGEAWVKAEGRIIADVLAGKDFATFAKATGTAQRELAVFTEAGG